MADSRGSFLMEILFVNQAVAVAVDGLCFGSNGN